MAKLTLQDIIAKKQEVQEIKTATVEVPSLGGEITIQSANKDDLRRYDEFMAYEYPKTHEPRELVKAMSKLILNNVVEPNLKDPALIEALGCKKNPEGVVDEMFDLNEIGQIAVFILELSGRKDANAVRLVDEIKN